MKKTTLIFLFSLLFFSCEKDFLIPDKDVPGWLKAEIRKDEQIMHDYPSSCLYYGAWLRYTWR